MEKINIKRKTSLTEREIEEDRRAADFQTAEKRQMAGNLAMYTKETSEFLLFNNFTLDNHCLVIVLRLKHLLFYNNLTKRTFILMNRKHLIAAL